MRGTGLGRPDGVDAHGGEPKPHGDFDNSHELIVRSSDRRMPRNAAVHDAERADTTPKACEGMEMAVPSDDHTPAVEPEDLERLFVQRVNNGDVDGLVALFEPDAVMAPGKGRMAIGREEIREVLTELVASGEKLTLGDQRPTLRVGDLALTSTRLVSGDVTAEVARRQADGTWRWVIDRWSVLGDGEAPPML